MPNAQELIDQISRAGGWIIILQLLLILVVTWVALRFAHGVVDGALRRLFEREAVEGTAQQLSAVEVERRRATLEDLTYSGLRVVILVIAFLMVLAVLHLDIGPAIAGLGIIGLALSLGAQNLVRDYVAGAFVLIENQYSKGDVVQIADARGTVEDISLRRTVLRDVDGTVHFVPNGLIEVASNLSRSWAGITVDIPISYEQDLPAFTAAIDAAGERFATDPQWRAAVFEAPRVTRVERLGEQGMVLHVAGSVAAVHRFTAPGALRGLILEACQQRGLSIGWRPMQPAAEDNASATAQKPTDRSPA